MAYHMIIGTSLSEVREFDGAKVLPELEEITGADVMISPLSLGVTESLLPLHLQKGALLIQVKRGHDLPQSIVDGRLVHSLARMRATGAKSWQCILLFIGSLYIQDGVSMINGQPIRQSNWTNPYMVCRMAMSKWAKRGGSVEEIASIKMFKEWAEVQLRLINELQKEPVHTVYQKVDAHLADENDPLQCLEYITDWRKTLFTLPGLGPARIQALLNVMRSLGSANPNYEPTLIQALMYLTRPSMGLKVPGIGKGTMATIRSWLGLNEDYLQISLEAEVEEE